MKTEEKTSPCEKSVWEERGASQVQGLWRAPDGRPALLASLMVDLLEEAHGLTHCGKQQIERKLTHWWHLHLPAMVENFVRECIVCNAYNVKCAVKPHQGRKGQRPMVPGGGSGCIYRVARGHPHEKRRFSISGQIFDQYQDMGFQKALGQIMELT